MAILIQYKNDTPGVKIAIERDPFRIGRSEDNDLCIDDQLSSRSHAVIEQVSSRHNGDGSDYVLRDLDSTNGTFVNHAAISAHLLQDGDMIRIGQTFFRFAQQTQASDPAATRILKKSIIPGLYYTSEKEKK